MRIEYHPGTAVDLSEAVEFYNRQKAGQGDKFRQDVYALISRIQEQPLAFGQIDEVRRGLLQSFPYSVIYRITDQQTIRILIIRHHRRKPNFGASRK